MKSEGADADVLIVGGGFSGTMMAAQLARRGLRVALVEGAGRAGQGTAYSTRDEVHLLNVPAAKMSAWPERPDDFIAAGHDAGSFAPRRAYGAYLSAILDRARAEGVELIAATAVAAERAGDWQVMLDDGRRLTARALVLAHGNQVPEPMRVGDGIRSDLFVNNPWGSEARAAIERVVRDGGPVLILGTGLTMVDLILSLDAAGHRGAITALSRRGQVPRSHAPHEVAPVSLDAVPRGNVMALWRWLRQRGAAVGWRGAVDSLRPHAHKLWASFDPGEQQRFLRHARPYWDVHRHRIAPQVAQQLTEMIAEDRLHVMAGRLASVAEEDGRLSARIARRGQGPTAVEAKFDVAFNCTGPLGAMGRTRDPLLRQLIDSGGVAIDPLGIGLAVDGGSRAGQRLWALGPLTKGMFWEIVAVPDIRGQVAQVADDIAKELQG